MPAALSAKLVSAAKDAKAAGLTVARVTGTQAKGVTTIVIDLVIDKEAEPAQRGPKRYAG